MNLTYKMDQSNEGVLHQISQAVNFNEVSRNQPSIEALQLSEMRIEQLTIKILNDFDPNIFKHYFAPNITSLLTYLDERYGVLAVVNSLPSVKKGKKDLVNKIISIESEVELIDRYAFVFRHESDHNRILGKYLMEWEANYFANNILMPKQVILARLIKYQLQNTIRNKGRIYIDNAPHNIQLFKMTINALAEYFGVSFTAMEFRMADLGIIRYANAIKRPSAAFNWNVKSVQTIKSIFNGLTLKEDLSKFVFFNTRIN